MESMQLLREATREGHAAVVSGTVATIYRSHGGLHNADTHGAFETTVGTIAAEFTYFAIVLLYSYGPRVTYSFTMWLCKYLYHTCA